MLSENSHVQTNKKSQLTVWWLSVENRNKATHLSTRSLCREGRIHFWLVPGVLTESLHQIEIGFLEEVVSVIICILQY